MAVTRQQLEVVRKYLDDDCQMHLAGGGKWKLDAGKLDAAFEAAGILAQEENKTSLEDLKLFTMYSDGYTSLHSLSRRVELAEGTGGRGLSTPEGLPHIDLGHLEIDIHRWKGRTGSDSELEDLGCPEMSDVYSYIEAHPEVLRTTDDE